MQKQNLFGLNITEIEGMVTSYGHNPSLAKDICTWMYRRGCRSVFDMVSIPMDLRKKLDSTYSIQLTEPESWQVSSDGTTKYLLRTMAGNPFETVFMPGEKRNTLCISTQSGCRMDCGFCYTGRLGLLENLTAANILGQLVSISQKQQVNRIVIMGMGEPLDNPIEVMRALEILNAPWGYGFGAVNITLSTVGIIPQLQQLVTARLCNIAISLHSPFPNQRARMMPAEHDFPILEVVYFLKKNQPKKPLRLSFEYVVLPSENDSPEHAQAIATLLKQLVCHVNVIPLNTAKQDERLWQAARAFQQMLMGLNIRTTLRQSRGQDIEAACGMMAGRSPDVIPPVSR